MFKFIKNKFFFIIALSVITLILLVVGAIALYKDEKSNFKGDGYIISTSTKKSAKYYFKANTEYKNNADNDVTFKETESNKKIAVNPASFVHYNNGSIAFLKQGALVNLNEINSKIISYYNVNRSNLIEKNNNIYTLTSNGNEVNVNAFVGRISDNKYIVAGSNLEVKIPTNDENIKGDYFEITYIKDGIVKIDNKDISYQVTAQNSFVYVGNNITINLGNEKILYDGSAKMLLSQITINGDENINLDDVQKQNTGGGSGEGSGEGQNGENNNINGSESGNGTGNGNGESGESGSENETKDTTTKTETTTDQTNTTGSGTGTGTGSGTGNNSGGTSGGTVKTTKDAKIELINAKITSTSIDASFQLNNASAITGDLIATFTNILTNESLDPVAITPQNGTFNINKIALLPNTEYNLNITETTKDSSKQYFQKTFRTKDLGITLEKQYATENSLSYNVIFSDNSDVEKVKISILDSNGTNEGISPSEYIVTKKDVTSTIEFIGLETNSSYSVNIDTLWIDNIAYTNLYNINRIDTTLKQTPSLSDIKVKANAEEVKFNIKVNNIADPDESILSYVYKIYEADSINIDGTDPVLAYSLTKNDSDAIELDLSQIAELKTGVNYRCKVIAQYNDNEMIREVESDYSGNFLIKSKPNITWETISITADQILGRLSLIDASCSIPIRGRNCLSENNNIILKYYKVGEDESTAIEKTVNFNPNTLRAEVQITENLHSGTAYIFKMYSNYYDDNNILHNNIQIGDPFYLTTDESTKVKFVVNKENESGKDEQGAEVVTFDARLKKPQDSIADEETAEIKLNLYSGSYNTPDKLIGTYTLSDRNLIEDFYNNFTITNKLFYNEELGYLDSLQKMIRATNNQSRTLNRAYTVEIAEITSIYGSTDSIEIEDKVYTFKLTPSYYLDSRIASNPNYKYVNVTTIKKEDLSEEEYGIVANKISNLDELNDDTIVGITIENSLSDEYVDSAFTYEKVTVDYVVYNTTTNKEAARISVNMDNKYQPKSQTIYLEPTEADDGEQFTRGYNYKIGYELKFITENGDNPTYTNKKLYENKEINRQTPTVEQYISTSNATDITYRYKIKDVDGALFSKNLYYTLGNSTDYKKVSTPITTDNEYHDISIPIETKSNYTIYLNTKTSAAKSGYTEFSKYRFESLYNYDNSNLFTLANNNDNTLKIKFINNDITKRAVAYKVTIKATDDNSLEEYSRYFLTSHMKSEKVETGEVDAEGNNITEDIKYIAIDYANISKYMKHNLKVTVEDYYDSGLIGLNQTFTNGLILENYVTSKYLNIYNSTPASNKETKDEETKTIEGIYKTKEDYNDGSDNIQLYNQLIDTDNQELLEGYTYYSTAPSNDRIGINYNLSMSKAGITFNNGNNDYLGYNPKVLKKVTLKTENDAYRFNNIIPRISLKTSTSTINSLKLNVTSSGVYGQFIKNNSPHNIYYIDVYSDQELTNKVKTITSNITINDSTATAEIAELKNLKPATTYYITVSAYVDNILTRLYDMDTTTSYVTKTYELSTLNNKGILSKINFSVEPIDYSGESSKKELKWILNLKNKENYKVRFELFDKDDNAVKFDGKEATNCNIDTLGDASNGYVNGCYIQISKEDVNDLSANYNKYTFTGDDFVFGNEYYKLRVYAIPYTNNSYLEEDKLLLYENEALKTEKKDITNDISYDINIPTLKEPTFTFNNLISGSRCLTEKDENGNVIKENGVIVCASEDEDEFFIDFSLTVSDIHKVIKYGTYNITLKDINNNVIATKEAISTNTLGKVFTFANLLKDTTYTIEITYGIYRNNYGLTEEEKVKASPLNKYISTPVTSGITPGNITAQKDGDSKVILSYSRYNLITKITRVDYTIRQNPGTSMISGSYTIGTDQDTSFDINNTNAVTKLTIDFSDKETFTLNNDKSYLISTQYYYKEGQEEVLLTDGRGISTFTAELNP